MSMEMTWLDFQLSTDNQNGRHLATKFFFLTLTTFFRKRDYGGHPDFLI